MSRDLTSLVEAFTIYVRPILEDCSVTWNPMLKKDIEALAKVQRRFTKRIPGLKDLTLSEVNQVKTAHQSRTSTSPSWLDIYLQIGVWFN